MNQPTVKAFGLPRKLWVLLLILAIGILAYTWWKTQYAWHSGYGNGDMSNIANADPRALSGGDMTTFHKGYAPFEQSPENLPWQYEELFEKGDGLFDKAFTPGDGLKASNVKTIEGMRRVGAGPLFNADGCSACHFRDGRVEKPYVIGGAMVGMFLRMSVPDGKGGWTAPNGYHEQLHDRAVDGVKPEGLGHIQWTEIPGKFPDGEAYSLRKPNYVIDNLGYGTLPANVVIEARTAPPVHGVGLIEAINEHDILQLAQLQVGNVDGVSGKPNYVNDPETGQRKMGRFSLKSNEVSVRAQAAGAAFNDMGVTSLIHRLENCKDTQLECLKSPNGGTPSEPEMSADFLENLTTYLRLLAVPARRGLDNPKALHGEKMFAQARCTACHVSTMKTGDFHPLPRLRNQTIHPYSDFLLHDMGKSLTGRPDGEATAQEWRTPPLWGIGLNQRTAHHTIFLHDQRARGFNEAILWHGGEAEAAKQRYMNMSKADREAVIKFLESL